MSDTVEVYYQIEGKANERFRVRVRRALGGNLNAIAMQCISAYSWPDQLNGSETVTVLLFETEDGPEHGRATVSTNIERPSEWAAGQVWLDAECGYMAVFGVPDGTLYESAINGKTGALNWPPNKLFEMQHERPHEDEFTYVGQYFEMFGGDS